MECSHYMRNYSHEGAVKPLRTKAAKDLLRHIEAYHGTLAFARRWLDDDGAKNHLAALRELVDADILQACMPLCDIQGSYTAQFEHTFLLRPTCKGQRNNIQRTARRLQSALPAGLLLLAAISQLLRSGLFLFGSHCVQRSSRVAMTIEHSHRHAASRRCMRAGSLKLELATPCASSPQIQLFYVFPHIYLLFCPMFVAFTYTFRRNSLNIFLRDF